MLRLAFALLTLSAAGCAGSSDAFRFKGTSPERRDLQASVTRDEESCMEAARARVQEGSPCGQADVSDRRFDAREARRCALVRCMNAKGYTSYGADQRAAPDRW
jgi:hypothetical protein